MGILDLIFPKTCLICHKSSKYICEDCLSKVKLINHLDPEINTFSIFKYEGVVRKAIIKIKYSFAYDVSKELALVCAKSLKNNKPFTSKNIVLIPIPLHTKREKWRGFNQSEILGKEIAKILNWDYKNDILVRPIEGPTQVGLKGIERVRNIRGKFAVNPSLKKTINRDSAYVIFDDVATTGSTLKEAIKVMKENGAVKVIGLTIAK